MSVSLLLSASSSLAYSTSMLAVSSRAPPCSVGMSANAPSKKRGLPLGEEPPAGVENAKPRVVGRVKGLDFLGLSEDYDATFLGFNFAYYREAEIKHGRLAMLAAVAWPLQEIFNPIAADWLYSTTGVALPDVLAESNGASPSLVNGGLFQLELLPALLLFTLGCTTLERSDLATRRTLNLGWNEFANAYGVYGRMPGDFQFDPLNFYRPLSDEGKVGAQERELANGRLAMLAIASYVGTEWVYHEPVVSATPALFQPIIFSPVFRAFMDASFGMASTAPN